MLRFFGSKFVSCVIVYSWTPKSLATTLKDTKGDPVNYKNQMLYQFLIIDTL